MSGSRIGFAAVLSVLAGLAGTAQDAPAPSALQAIGVHAERVRYRDRDAVHLTELDAKRNGGLALLEDVRFQDGTIELDVAGMRGPSAIPSDRGFIGVAFRVAADASSYEAIYLRPDNGRAADQIRRNHATQYIAFPDFGFDRMRKEWPERYESYVDLEYGAWTHMRVEVSGLTARLFVHDASQPVLIVDDLKLGRRTGGVGLWIGAGTNGYFANVHVRSAAP